MEAINPTIVRIEIDQPKTMLYKIPITKPFSIKCHSTDSIFYWKISNLKNTHLKLEIPKK